MTLYSLIANSPRVLDRSIEFIAASPVSTPFSNRGNKREFPGHQSPRWKPGGTTRWPSPGSVPEDYLLGQGYSLTRHGFHSL